MLSWLWRKVNHDNQLIKNVLDPEADVSWGKLGPTGNTRMSRLWVEAHFEEFFLTLSPCIAFKFKLECFYNNAILLKRCSNSQVAPEFMLCKPALPTAGCVVTLELLETDNALMTRIIATMLSGKQVMDKTVYTRGFTWWQVAQALPPRHVNLMTLKLLIGNNEISRAFWYNKIGYRVPPLEDEFTENYPKIIHDENKNDEDKDDDFFETSKSQKSPVTKAKAQPKQIRKDKKPDKDKKKSAVAQPKVAKRPAMMKRPAAK
eukprot:Skav202491  [mRNA]  locus=scaffold32:13953:14735:+ [translate_table: standard]